MAGKDFVEIDPFSAPAAGASLVYNNSTKIWDPGAAGAMTLVVWQTSAGVATAYTTIGAAIAAAVAAGVSNDLISVPPGIWAESFSIPSGLTVASIGGRRVTHITGAGATGARVTMDSNTALMGFKVTGPTDAHGAIEFVGATTPSHIEDVALIGAGGACIGILHTGAAQLRSDNSGAPSGAFAAIIKQTAGFLICRAFTVVTPDAVTDAFKIEGGTFGFNSTFCIGAGLVDGLHVSGTGSVLSSSAQFDYCSGAGIHVEGNSASVDLRNVNCGHNNTQDLLVDNNDARLRITSCHLHRDKVSIPPAVSDAVLVYMDDEEDDEAWVVDAELAVGDKSRGREIVGGEGDSYTDNMVVLTTDNTAAPGVDGGNLTDVSTAAASASGSTVTFQGVGAGHAILFCSNNEDPTGEMLKHFGLKIRQTTAAVEVTPKSFMFEIYSGAAWVEIDIMAIHADLPYTYANEVFIRANLSEQLLYGITNSTTYGKKTINGTNGYWSRIRIKTDLTTAPVFEQFKLGPSRFEGGIDGTQTFFGRARFRRILAATGNVFGEEGNTGDVTVAVGGGGAPTGWNHNIKNSELNTNGDAAHMQLGIPPGTDTSQPVHVTAKIVGTPGGAAPTIEMSLLATECEATMEADPTGGIPPVARTLANTETHTAKNAQSYTNNTTALDATKTRRVAFEDFRIADHYEGDDLWIRCEMTDDGADNVDCGVVSIEVSAVAFAHGARL